MITTRPETLADMIAIRTVNEKAFKRPNEADLVDSVRASRGILASLVAVDANNTVIGHILVTPVSVEGYDEIYECASLGPIAVAPAYQGGGVGTELINAAVEHCKKTNYPVIFVIGDPNYYGRFGFESAAPHRLECEFDVPEDALMVRLLHEDALQGIFGTIYYLPEFKEFE